MAVIKITRDDGTLRTLDEIEAEIYRDGLAICDGNMRTLSNSLDVGYGTVYRKLDRAARAAIRYGTEAKPVDAKPFQANCCRMPGEADEREAIAYRGIQQLMVRAHCADKREAHLCAGKVTITRDAILLQCPRCGDTMNMI